MDCVIITHLLPQLSCMWNGNNDILYLFREIRIIKWTNSWEVLSHSTAERLLTKCGVIVGQGLALSSPFPTRDSSARSQGCWEEWLLSTASEIQQKKMPPWNEPDALARKKKVPRHLLETHFLKWIETLSLIKVAICLPACELLFPPRWSAAWLVPSLPSPPPLISSSWRASLLNWF